jgi:tetratricopeptide (TPR) repeat protein
MKALVTSLLIACLMVVNLPLALLGQDERPNEVEFIIEYNKRRSMTTQAAIKMNQTEDKELAVQVEAYAEWLYKNAPIEMFAYSAALTWANALVIQGKVYPAATVLRNAEADMKDIEAKANLALSRGVYLMGAKDYREGQKAFAELADRYPQSIQAPRALWFQANYQAQNEGNLRNSIRLYERLARHYPDTEEGKIALQLLPGMMAMDPNEFRSLVLKKRQQESRENKP